MERSEAIMLLAEGRVRVSFTKKDGTDRVMVCTRKPDIIPVEKHAKSLIVERDETLNVRAFDLEKNEWRSFNIDTVTSIEPVTI